MAVNIVVPTLGESVTEATVTRWLKDPGEPVKADEPLVELETDKVTLEVPAPADGVLGEIKVPAGENVEVGAVLGVIGDGAAAGAKPAARAEAVPEPAPEPEPEPAPAPEPAGTPAPAVGANGKDTGAAAATAGAAAETPLSPAVRKLVEEQGIDPKRIKGTGKGGRLTKGDVLAFMQGQKPRDATPCSPGTPPPAAGTPPPAAETRPPSADGGRTEERVRMTRLRRTIARRLKEAQETAAMLTTFNEVDMKAVMDLRAQYRETFQAKHGVRLGFLSFFTKACVVALKEIPAVNAQIDGDDIVYKNYVDLGIAVGTEQGLVVPVLRDADKKTFAEIEAGIADLGRRARDGQLKMEELTGGTFTITNGGVYGSLMSTPIINPPQSAILGLHKIQPRPMAIGDKVEVRPMMYLALSYDHRIIDGREAVTFLVRVKECIEDPQRILLDM